MDKLLIADDESDVVSLLKLILEAEGYQVVPASSGDEALRLIDVEAPDLILLDLMMPGKSGLETCRLVKSQPRTREVPVIIFSALGREVDRKLSSEAGASSHLTKPFNNAGLITEVKRCLNESRGWKFSRTLGVEHSKLAGRKMLLEVEPPAQYERTVRDFALECSFLRESVVVMTKSTSGLRQVLDGDQGINFVELESASQIPPLLHDFEGPLSVVIDGLTDVMMAGDKNGGMYGFAQQVLQTLNEPRVTCLFLLNPSAHDPIEVARVRGLFSNHLLCGKEGLGITRLA